MTGRITMPVRHEVENLIRRGSIFYWRPRILRQSVLLLFALLKNRMCGAIFFALTSHAKVLAGPQALLEAINSGFKPTRLSVPSSIVRDAPTLPGGSHASPPHRQ